MSWLNSLRPPPLRQGLALCAALLPQLLCAWTIELGDSRSDVLKAYGTPPSRMVTASRELFRYQEGELIIEKGVVVDIRFRNKEPALLNPGFIKESRAAEEAQTAAAAAQAAAAVPETQEKPPAPTPADKRPDEGPGHTMLWMLGGGLLLGGLLFYRMYRKFKAEAEAAELRKLELVKFRSGAGNNAPRQHAPAHIAVLIRPNLDQLEWRALDELVRSYFHAQGWVSKRTRVEINGSTRSLLCRRNESRPSAFLFCVPAVGAILGADQVRLMEGILVEECLPEGFIVTTGDFSSEARALALQSRRLELISGDALMHLFRKLPRKPHAAIVSQVFSGEYAVPSCTACESKLSLHEGPPARWLCSQHPALQHGFPVAQHAGEVVSPA